MLLTNVFTNRHQNKVTNNKVTNTGDQRQYIVGCRRGDLIENKITNGIRCHYIPAVNEDCCRQRHSQAGGPKVQTIANARTSTRLIQIR